MFEKCKEHKAEILIGCGIIGGLAATGLGIWVTTKQEPKIREMKEANPDISKKEIVKTVLPKYIPVFMLNCTSIACIIFASRTYIGESAALATACQATGEAFRIYKHAVEETIDENQKAKINEKIDEANKQRYSSCNGAIFKDGKRLFIETMTGREFYSTQEELLNIKDTLSELSMSEDSDVAYNDFYDAVGLEMTKAGDYIFFPKGAIEMRVTSESNLDANWDSALLVTFPGLLVATDYEVKNIYRTY